LRAIGPGFWHDNSAVCAIGERGEPLPARFGGADGVADTFRSILFFEQGEGPSAKPGERDKIVACAGPAAITRYLEAGGDGRLIQSLKSFLRIATLHRPTSLGANTGWKTWSL
jgi:hypothetical protein